MPKHGHWPEYAGPTKNCETVSRQWKRRDDQKRAFIRLHADFGGLTDRGGYYYAEGMNRRIARAISREAMNG